MPITPIHNARWFGMAPQQARQELNMAMFMRLLTVQLTHQNPLEPMNDRDFFAQMAQLGSVQGMEQMKRSLEISQGASLMGKRVTASLPASVSGLGGGTLVSGIVRKMTINSGEQWLGIETADGLKADVRLSAVQTVEN